MAPLATAYVRLRTDSTVLAAEATRDAAKAGEAAGAAMGTRMSSGLSRTFKAAAGLGAATGLVELGRKVYDLADQFEGARARVEQNTQNIGVAFSNVQKPLDNLDSSMAAFGFTVTDTENSFSQLVTATHDPAKALRDVGLAADIARGRHIGLDQATQYLMRVETGHVALLGRLGIATRDASGHMFTQQEALEALNRAYGGNASRFAETLAGHMAAARAEMQLAGTQIGVALLPAMADLANVVAHDVLPPIVLAARWLDRDRAVVEPLVKDVLLLTVAWKGYTIATKAAAAITKLLGGEAAATAVAVRGEAAAAETAKIANTPGVGGLPMPGPGGIGAIPLLAVGAIPDLKPPPAPPANLQGLLDQQSQILKTNPAAAADFKRMAGANGVIKETVPQLQAWINKWKQAPPAINAAAAATTAAGTAAARTAEQIATHAQKTINFKQAQDAVRQAMHDAAQTAADSGRALQGNSDAALANRNALMGQVSAVLNVISVMKQNSSSAANQSNMLNILTRAVEQNAIKLYGDKTAVDALLASLGLLPGAVDAAAAAMAVLPKVVPALPSQTQQNLNSDTVAPGALHQLNQGVDKAKATANKQGSDVAKSFVGGYTPIVAKATNDAAKKAATAAADAFNALKDRATADLQTISDAVKSTQSSVAGFADFSATGTDALGASGLNTDVAGQLKAKAGRLEQFARVFNQLDRAGLDAHLMAQFAQIGPDAIPAMQALLHSGRRGIGQVNRIEQRIQTAAGQVATTSAAEQNSGLIHKDLTTLPAKLGREFAKGLKNVHVSVSLRETDRKNGIAVVTAP